MRRRTSAARVKDRDTPCARTTPQMAPPAPPSTPADGRALATSLRQTWHSAARSPPRARKAKTNFRHPSPDLRDPHPHSVASGHRQISGAGRLAIDGRPPICFLDRRAARAAGVGSFKGYRSRPVGGGALDAPERKEQQQQQKPAPASRVSSKAAAIDRS
ncbi:uncharacterized protein A4U43_C08F8510 [Asparagus officinalis]|nr:uncharacterized protein A4U43_C08F8510 [Asparagus officinalis]